MSSWKITAPAPAGGFSKEAHLDHLVMFVKPKSEEVAKFSGEGVQTAARCEFVVCETCALVLTDVLVFGDALAPRIADVAEIVGGRLTLGKARAGRSAPYLLEDATTDDDHAMEAFLDKYAVRMKSGKIVIETPSATDAEESF